MEKVAKLKEDVLKKEALVKRNLEKYSELEINEFHARIRTYKFAYKKIKEYKKLLKILEEKLNKNENSFLMLLLKSETYRSTQDYVKKINCESKIEFYEFEILKITGKNYVHYQKEYEEIDFLDPHYENISDELKVEHDLIHDLYQNSLKWNILQSMGLKE
jgi:hypothetical protein